MTKNRRAFVKAMRQDAEKHSSGSVQRTCSASVMGNPMTESDMGFPISQTPRTNAAARRTLDRLVACKNESDYKEAVKGLVKDLLDTAKQLETELTVARTPNSSAIRQ